MRPLHPALISLYTLLALFNPVAGYAAPYSELDTFSYGGPLPLRQLINNMKGSASLGDEEHALSHFDWEVGMQLENGWRIGAFLRHDYYTRFDPDTLRLIHQDKNDLPVETNQRYDIWFKIHHLKADGVRIHMPQLNHGSWQLRLSVSLFHARGLSDGTISGQIDTTSNSFSGLVDLDYRYNRDQLLDRQVDSPVGWGYGIDIELQWQPSSSINAYIQIKDIAARVRWQQAPFTTAQLTSSTVNFDSNGFIETTPALSGFEGYRSYTQKLPLQSKMQISYRVAGQYSLFATNEIYSTEHFLSIGFTHTTRGVAYSLGWQIRNQALQLGWQRESLRVKLTADHIVRKKIKTFGIELSWLFGS
ncbi:MAG: hypothetical protein P1U80_11615 [Pseudomonadales bacterium]|nr:hypothetical protein [Pseudomonadales bacterium]